MDFRGYRSKLNYLKAAYDVFRKTWSGYYQIVHAHYGLSPAMVEVFVVGLVLGLVRLQTNTTTCLVVHAGYNFLNLLLLPYFPYLLSALL